MKKPTLKQFAALTPGDFEKNPIWACCHILDYDEKWYPETDEETFRPWVGSSPVRSDGTDFLIKCTFTLRDKRVYPGFIAPRPPKFYPFFLKRDLAEMQPIMIVDGHHLAFYHGMFARSLDEWHSLLGTLSNVFPVRFVFDAKFGPAPNEGKIRGVYFRPNRSLVRVS